MLFLGLLLGLLYPPTQQDESARILLIRLQTHVSGSVPLVLGDHVTGGRKRKNLSGYLAFPFGRTVPCTSMISLLVAGLPPSTIEGGQAQTERQPCL